MEAAAVAAPAVVPQDFEAKRGKSRPVLMPERMSLSENVLNNWVVDLPMTVSLEEALDPAFWAHVSAQMSPSDQIILRAEDGSWIAYLVVAYCERNYAKVVLDHCLKLDADTSAPMHTIKHKVEWKGPRMKYSVIRTADSAVLKEGCVTKDEATAWMRDHEQTMSR